MEKQHPGEVLKEMLERRKINQQVASEAMSVTQATISRFCGGKSRLTIDLAVRISIFLSDDVRYWLALQNDHDLSLVNMDNYKDVIAIEHIR